jgi:hypothetical protein
MTSLAWMLALILTAIALLHFYWGVGGTWAASAALPKHPDGRVVFTPGTGPCFAVTGAVGAVAYLCLARVGIVPAGGMAPHLRAGLLMVSGVFAFRSIGDFRYVGFFRKIRGTDFSRLDRFYYTPLCVILSVALAWLGLAKIA